MDTSPTCHDERTDLMANNHSPGTFPAIGLAMCQTLRDITERGNDAEVRKRRDGTYDVFEVQKSRPKENKPR